MGGYDHDGTLLSFQEWEDELDGLVGGTLELFVCGKQHRDFRHYRGHITAIRLSSRGQFQFELERRRMFNQSAGAWQQAPYVERLLHPIEVRDLDFILGPFIFTDQTIFWTYGKEPHGPEQCLWIFPPEVAVPPEPFSDEETAGLLRIFIQVVSPYDVRFDGKEWPSKTK